MYCFCQLLGKLIFATAYLDQLTAFLFLVQNKFSLVVFAQDRGTTQSCTTYRKAKKKKKKKVAFMWDTGDIRSFRVLSALRQVLLNIISTLAMFMMTSVCKLTCEKACGNQTQKKEYIHESKFLLSFIHTKAGLFKVQLRVTLLYISVVLFDM